MTLSPCMPTSLLATTDPEPPPPGQDLRDTALQLRLLLGLGTSLAIATVLCAQGAAIRRTGTVLAVSTSGQTIGFNPAGPLDGAIRKLATEALLTGQERLERLEIDAEAASYIGLTGGVALDVHAASVHAGDPVFSNTLRHLDRGDAAVIIIGTRGVSGYAEVGPAHVAGSLGWAALPTPVIDDARSMLETRQTAWRTYGPRGEKGLTGTQVWMQSFPRV
jgi:xanthine/CO dehydrogenase XdhC/CoxF family maturation factor